MNKNDELFRLRVNNSGSEGLPLEDVAIRARIEDATYKMCGHRAWNSLKMSINDICDLPTDVTFDEAEEALASFAIRNGISALVNKVVKMCADELNARTFEAYETTVGEKMHQLGPSCVWCKERNCANCPYVETPKGNIIHWHKMNGEVKHFKK